MVDHYYIDINYPNVKKELKGIQDSRRWIANYVPENGKELSLQSVD